MNYPCLYSSKRFEIACSVHFNPFAFSYQTKCTYNIHTMTQCIKHFIIQLMHNIKYVDTIKIIKYLKVFQHVSDHRGSNIRQPCKVLGLKLQEDSIVSVDMDLVHVNGEDRIILVIFSESLYKAI